MAEEFFVTIERDKGTIRKYSLACGVYDVFKASGQWPSPTNEFYTFVGITSSLSCRKLANACSIGFANGCSRIYVVKVFFYQDAPVSLE
uniref:Galectin n=1 Tax=Parascaris univalens TaxID=6257 RepID=A0A915C5Q8_PARUN